MSETKHTPGPWEAVNTGRHWNNETIDNWIVTYGKDGEQIIDHCYEEADARLIAASPDLLAACKLAYQIFDEGENDIEAWDEAFATIKSALAKADGKEVGRG